jgi:O-antigen/teichoic acid export membrane protein
MVKAGKISEAARHSIIYGLGSVAQSALGFVLLPILTGRLGKEDFGVYSLILMASTVASAVFYLGMTSALPRSYFDYPDGEERRAIFTTAFAILITGALMQTMVGYWGKDFLAKLLVRNELYGSAVAWAFFGGAVTFVNQYFFSYLRLLRSSIASVAFSLVSLVCGVGFTLWLLDISSDSVVAPFKAIAYSQLLIAIIFALIYGKKAFTLKLQRKEITPLLKFGIASIITSFGGMILDWADRIIIEHYMTLADVGEYSAAVRVSALIGVILVSPFTQIWSPMMMEYRTDKNIKQLFSDVFAYFFIAGGLILSSAAFLSPELLRLLIRYEFTPNLAVIFLVVAIANLIYGSTNIVVAGIFYERKVFLLPLVYYPIAALKILINLVFIPVYGITAAAAATLVSSILLPIGIYALAKKYFSFTIAWNRIIKLVSILLFPLGYMSLWALELLPELHMATRLVLMALTFFLIFRFCFNGNERRQLQHVLVRISSR